MGDDGGLDLLDIRLAAYLRVELLGGDGPALLDDYLPLLLDAEPRVVDDERAIQNGLDDHIAGQMAPLIESRAQLPLHTLAEGVLADEGQLVVEVEFLPGQLVDPEQWSAWDEIVEARPLGGALALDGQRGDGGVFLGQAPNDVAISLRAGHLSFS